MIVQQILALVFTKRLEKASDHINWRRLEKQELVFLYFSDFSTYFVIEREKKSIIILVRADKSIWIFPKVATCWLIKNIVPDYVILSLEVFDNFQPHFNKFVVHPIFICKKIVRKANNVIRDVVFEEWHLQAVLFKRITILISSEIYFKGCRKAK